MTEQRAQMLSQVKSRERSILKNVYLWMTAGLALTAVVSYLVATNASLMRMFLGSSVSFLFIVIAQFAVVFFLMARLDKMTSTTAIASFGAYSILTGITLSVIF